MGQQIFSSNQKDWSQKALTLAKNKNKQKNIGAEKLQRQLWRKQVEHKSSRSNSKFEFGLKKLQLKL